MGEPSSIIASNVCFGFELLVQLRALQPACGGAEGLRPCAGKVPRCCYCDFLGFSTRFLLVVALPVPTTSLAAAYLRKFMIRRRALIKTATRYHFHNDAISVATRSAATAVPDTKPASSCSRGPITAAVKVITLLSSTVQNGKRYVQLSGARKEHVHKVMTPMMCRRRVCGGRYNMPTTSSDIMV